MGDVEHQRSRRIGHIDRMLAAQPQSNEIFRQEHAANALPCIRLVRPDPQELRQREVGERRIRCEAEKA